MVGKLEKPEIEALLMSAAHAHLGCSAKGRTYVVPISFAYDGRRCIGYTSPGMKTEMMRANPDVCIQVEEIADLANWRSAIIWGRYEELNGSEAAIALGYLIDKYGPIFEEHPAPDRRGREITPPRADGGIAVRVVYAVEVGEMSGRFERSTE